MDPEPAADRLLAHLRDHHGIDAVTATRISVHKPYVFRIDRADGAPWVARAFPPDRPAAHVLGDAAILRFLEEHAYPAERVAVDRPVSDFEGSTVLATRLVDGTPLPEGTKKFSMMGELLGRLHALPPDGADVRIGGASGEDPRHEGAPGQDARAALMFLGAVDERSATTDRERVADLRAAIQAVDDGEGLPTALLHGNLLHAPDHALVGAQGPVAFNWKASGLGPRITDLAYLLWGTGDWNPRRPNQARVDAVVSAYRRHIEPTAEELERLAGVMALRPLYLAAFSYRRALAAGTTFAEWALVQPAEYFEATAAAARAAFRRSA